VAGVESTPRSRQAENSWMVVHLGAPQDGDCDHDEEREREWRPARSSAERSEALPQALSSGEARRHTRGVDAHGYPPIDRVHIVRTWHEGVLLGHTLLATYWEPAGTGTRIASDPAARSTRTPQAVDGPHQ